MKYVRGTVKYSIVPTFAKILDSSLRSVRVYTHVLQKPWSKTFRGRYNQLYNIRQIRGRSPPAAKYLLPPCWLLGDQLVWPFRLPCARLQVSYVALFRSWDHGESIICRLNSHIREEITDIHPSSEYNKMYSYIPRRNWIKTEQWRNRGVQYITIEWLYFASGVELSKRKLISYGQ